jgi:periplasmic copper chaperone A
LTFVRAAQAARCLDGARLLWGAPPFNFTLNHAGYAVYGLPHIHSKAFMKIKNAIKLIAAYAILTGAHSSFSHVVLQDGAAAAGASYRATLRVGHGCGTSPTSAMRVTIPAGFNGAQPMPKPGWTLSTKVGKLAQPYEAHGTKYTDGVLEITWTANGPDNALPADYYDEFVLRGTTPTAPGPIWFKVVQSCAQGSNDWVEVPASGSSTKDLKMPAALLEVLDIRATGGHSH